MIELAGLGVCAYLRKMKGIFFIVAVLCLMCASCGKKAGRVTVEETRSQTSRDRDPKLFATSDERFRDAKPGPVKGEAPENWLALPAAQFRDLNYRFGESGIGEVYVSVISGGVLENVNRWMRQFGRDPLSGADFAAMEKLPLAGTEGVWVEVEGEYASGMGAGGAKPGYGLAGVIAQVDGKIVTVKMLGPSAEVELEKPALKKFAASLELTE